MLTKKELKQNLPSFYKFLLDRNVVFEYIDNMHDRSIENLIGLGGRVLLYSISWDSTEYIPWQKMHHEWEVLYKDDN